jgi:hypothetical protein
MCPPGRPATAFYRRTVPPGWSAVGVLEELRLRRCAKSQGGRLGWRGLIPPAG